MYIARISNKEDKYLLLHVRSPWDPLLSFGDSVILLPGNIFPCKSVMESSNCYMMNDIMHEVIVVHVFDNFLILSIL